MQKILLTKDQLSLFDMGNKAILENGNQYMYFPYWIKKDINGETFLISPDKLPNELIKLLDSRKNENRHT